jgi:hypothetical protein
MDFAIVEFIKDKTVAIVSTNWLLDRNICYWPTKPNTVDKFLRERALPGANWKKYEARVLLEYGM